MRNLGKPVELAGQYYKDGADEVGFEQSQMVILCSMLSIDSKSSVKNKLQVTFLNITGFRDFPLGDLPMLQVCNYPTLIF